MCGRYLNRRQKQEIAIRMKAKTVFEEPYLPDYNIAPTTFQPMVRETKDAAGEREMVLARWGLVPFFTKSLADVKGISTINARAEGIETARTWRAPFKRHRCLVPADGFYEWKNLTDFAKPKKQPYAITLKDDMPMAFAGLWDAWKDPSNGEWLQSFTIITTEANEIMSEVHTRMPVILRERDWARWLSRDGDVPPPLDLLRPFDSDAMQLAPCNPGIGRTTGRNVIRGPEALICPADQSGLPLNSA